MKETPQKLGFETIFGLVEKFHLQQSTGMIAYYMLDKFFTYHLDKDSGQKKKA